MRSREEIWKMKPKFRKSKCAKCKWRGLGDGYITKLKQDGKYKTIKVYCNYTSLNGKSCIQRIDKNNPYEVYDIRGDDYYNCLLFEPGNYQEDKEEDKDILEEEQK